MDQEGYRTKILNVSAFLSASGLRLVGTKKVNEEVFFIFTPKEKAQKLASEYFSGQAKVDPREMMARLNDLRDLIFGGNHE